MAGDKWTAEELKTLWSRFGSMSNNRLAALLFAETGIKRTETAVQVRANLMGLRLTERDGMVKLKEASVLLSIPYTLAHSRYAVGKIQGHRRGKCVWVSIDEVERLAELLPTRPARSYTKTQAMKALNYSETHVTRLLLSGKVRGVKFGDRWYVDADHVDAIKKGDAA